MATTPPSIVTAGTSASDPLPPAAQPTPPVQVQALEDPAALALRGRAVAAEDRQAAAAEAMNATQKALVQALSAPPAPASDAQLWLLLFQVALHGLLRHPTFGTPVAGAEAMASEALAVYRKKFPLAPTVAG